jgi:thiamine-phosphate pyrophosphorylase
MHHNFKTKYYFIDNFDTKNIDKVDKQTVVIFRNYELKKKDEVLLLKIKKICKKKKLKFYLSNNIKLALKLSLDGAYIPSFNKSFNHLNYSLKKEFEIIGSAHNINEIRVKEIQRVKKIFISSLFKMNKNYLGINKFKLICALTKKRTVALGGISKKNIKKLRLVNSPDFAGISYFKE